jgi:HSP20 family protein
VTLRVAARGDSGCGDRPAWYGSFTVPGADDALEKFLTFQREVNRLFRRIFEEGSSPKHREGEGTVARANVAERDGDLVVEVETPGVPAGSLVLEVSRDLIVIEGERPARAKGGGPVRFHALERETGRFRRVLEIPCPVDTRNIRARYHAGVLTIRLPKIEDRRGERRRVPIEEGGPDAAPPAPKRTSSRKRENRGA